MKTVRAIPSIARRLSDFLWLWFVLTSVAVGAAVWIQTDREVKELLDDSLIAAAQLIQANLPHSPRLESSSLESMTSGTSTPQQRFAWQLVSKDGHLIARSPGAPSSAWRASAQLGLFDVTQWRVYGTHRLRTEDILYVAQSHAERLEAGSDVAIGALLATLAIGAVSQFWLRRQTVSELAPLESLGRRMVFWNADASSPEPRPWGAAQRLELAPLHRALDTLSARIELQLKQERAFSAHTSHALRTPLAGIDTQLAVALREVDCKQNALRERLVNVRLGAQRMQRVVESMLALFRRAGELHCVEIDVFDFIQSVPVPPHLTCTVSAEHKLVANSDLLSAALFNILDNSVRHGASHVELRTAAENTLLIKDNGPGMTAELLAQVQTDLLETEQTSRGIVRMGLWLVQRVAKSHGGAVTLHSNPGQGLTIVLQLGPSASQSEHASSQYLATT